jgi:hypothetical protein
LKFVRGCVDFEERFLKRFVNLAPVHPQTVRSYSGYRREYQE